MSEDAVFMSRLQGLRRSKCACNRSVELSYICADFCEFFCKVRQTQLSAASTEVKRCLLEKMFEERSQSALSLRQRGDQLPCRE